MEAIKCKHSDRHTAVEILKYDARMINHSELLSCNWFNALWRQIFLLRILMMIIQASISQLEKVFGLLRTQSFTFVLLIYYSKKCSRSTFSSWMATNYDC